MASDGTNIVLYWGSGSPPCWRAMISLFEKQLGGFESNLIEFSKRGHKSPEVLALNPRGQVPTFRHGDTIVNESVAICFYLENVFKNQGTKLLPEDHKELATALQRTLEVLSLAMKGRAVVYKQQGISDDELKQRKQDLSKELGVWEDYLKSEYLVGDNFSMADVMMFPQLAYFVRYGLVLDSYPKLKAYYTKVSERESVKKSWPPHWKESDGLTALNGV